MIVIDKWAGLVTNASPYAIPPGAAVTQVNLQVIAPGQISLRPGTSAVTFTSHTGSTAAVVRMMRLPGSPDAVVYQGADGSVRIARGPQ
jgi:hypothetical protein